MTSQKSKVWVIVYHSARWDIVIRNFSFQVNVCFDCFQRVSLSPKDLNCATKMTNIKANLTNMTQILKKMNAHFNLTAPITDLKDSFDILLRRYIRPLDTLLMLLLFYITWSHKIFKWLRLTLLRFSRMENVVYDLTESLHEMIHITVS